MVDSDDSHAETGMDLPENRGSKLFQDSVHGSMNFHKLIVKFIDTRPFQRLRNIKQLSTTYLVYPAAAHNRFEHSLGVCWLAGKLLDKLEHNSPDTWKDIFPDEKESKAVKLAVQIAGLLHDLGHGPFSHTWEAFVLACGESWDHEHTSCELIDLMLWKEGKKGDENLTPLGHAFKEEFGDVQMYVQFVKDIILGKPSPDKKRLFLYQVVANKSNDIDVDKWDYFLRDAQHLRMSVAFDYERLMSLSQIRITEGASNIEFRDVERYSIQGMFRVRADLHIRAYQHRVAKCLEAMLIDAFKEANDCGYQIGGVPLSKVHEKPIIFSKLTDSVQELVHNSEEKEFAKARHILDRIATRKLYQNVGEWPLNVKQTEEEESENKRPQGLSSKQIAELAEKLENKFAITQSCINQGKYFDPMKNVRFYPKPGSTVKGPNNPTIKMDLPFYKLYVFQKEEMDIDITCVQKTVEEFLKDNNFINYDL